MADFVTQIDDWVNKAGGRLRELCLGTAFAVEARVKELTPVVTGNLRASWHVTVDPDKITIATGVAYGRRVEYGFVGEDSLGRYYHQEGRHMVQQTVAELPDIVEAQLVKVKGAP